jgi:hypothetical protein
MPGSAEGSKQMARHGIKFREMHWLLFIKLYAAVTVLYLLVTAGYLGWRYWPRK